MPSHFVLLQSAGNNRHPWDPTASASVVETPGCRVHSVLHSIRRFHLQAPTPRGLYWLVGMATTAQVLRNTAGPPRKDRKAFA